MKLLCRILGILVTTSVFTGCAYMAQQVKLDPKLLIGQSDIGKGTSVGVKVVDERPEQDIGHRGATYGKAAKITTDQDVAGIIYERVMEGLKNLGFRPTAFEEDLPRTLKVEIRLIEYSTSTGFWTGGVDTKAAFKVTCFNNGKAFERLYRVDNEKRVVVVPTAKENEGLINTAIEQVLQKMFNDQELLNFLAN